MLTSHPLATAPSQLAKPALHALTAQVPPEQLPVALAGAHVVPQPPQFATVSSGVSHPLFTSLSQSANSGLQAMAHAPPMHDGVPFEREQTLPHAPQLETSEPIAISQ